MGQGTKEVRLRVRLHVEPARPRQAGRSVWLRRRTYLWIALFAFLMAVLSRH